MAAVVAGCSGTNAGGLMLSSGAQDAGDAGLGGGGDADAVASGDGPAASDGGKVDATLGGSDADSGAMPMDVAVAPSEATADVGEASKNDVSDIAPLPSLHVVGNGIYDNAVPVLLAGVHHAGSEYQCVHNVGIFDGPSDAASVQAIKTWGRANAVRVPLNEDCWLGINGAPAQYSGAAYQNAISNYVTLLLENGLYPILDLHWSAPGSQLATGQVAMPDRDHSLAFWSQVAGMFKGNLGVVFDLFSEPNPANGQETADAWACWRDGTNGSDAGDAGSCAGVGYSVAGMQALLSMVRSAGANNLVLLGGVVGANALSQWSLYKPNDPANNVAASWHVYDDRACSTTSCFDSKVAPIAQMYPVVATELGEKACQGTFITATMNWLDSQRQGYLAFTWNAAWGSSCLSLITDPMGTPSSPYGQAYKTHLQLLPDGGGD
jgi:hypothetical protein